MRSVIQSSCSSPITVIYIYIKNTYYSYRRFVKVETYNSEYINI